MSPEPSASHRPVGPPHAPTLSPHLVVVVVAAHCRRCGRVASHQIRHHRCSPLPPDPASSWSDLVSSWSDPPPPVAPHRCEKGWEGRGQPMRRSRRREGERPASSRLDPPSPWGSAVARERGRGEEPPPPLWLCCRLLANPPPLWPAPLDPASTRLDPSRPTLSHRRRARAPLIPSLSASPRVKERGMGRGTRREGVSSAGLTGRRRAPVVSVEKKNARMARGLGRERERGGDRK